ncbi:hypothetical protein IAD21_03592 [Abditibacteriota bacterium]|nr:hypothetical protein IAD21_03592 [Abditibacteriota bacterium]
MQNIVRRVRELSPGSSPAKSPSPPSDRIQWWLVPLVLVILLLVFFRPFVLVGAGERGVVFSRFSGVSRVELGEGLHFIAPWAQSVTIYDVKSQTYTMSAASNETNTDAQNSNDALEALTRDGLPVSLELSIRFHPDPEAVWQLHQSVGPDYVAKILRPEIRSHVRMVVAKYPVTDVYGPRRVQMIEQMTTRLRQEFAANGVILDEVLLRDVSFSAQFQAAIEQKQVAQEDVARMAFERDRADKERRQKIIEAEGQAQSIRLKAAALAQNPDLTRYEYVQNLPSNVRTVVTDGRTILNLGDLQPNITAATDETPAPAPTTVPVSPQVQ